MMVMQVLSVVLLALSMSGALGTLTVSNVLGSNMVLQRGVQARVWGWNTPTYKQSVSIGTTAGADGLWQVSIAPKEAGGPYNITIEDEADNIITLTNVLFGDVWAFNGSEETTATSNFPEIRVFMAGNNISFTPLSQLAYVPLPWSLPSPAFMGGFSAVCWLHARDLFQSINVPIGLIESCWGGTIIEAWSSPAALAKCPTDSKEYIDAVNPNQNSVLWNAMIYPLLPTSIFGVLWYQGEQNTFEASIYGCREIALIQDWRTNFGTEFMFNFVQLAPWSGINIPDTREAQLQGLTQPRVGFATAVDLGDSTSPYNDIHPRYKQENSMTEAHDNYYPRSSIYYLTTVEHPSSTPLVLFLARRPVGKRLATTTLAVAFGQNLNWQPPQLLKAVLSTTSPNISFTIAVENVGGGLYYENNTCPSNVAVSNCSNFQIVLSDGELSVHHPLRLSCQTPRALLLLSCILTPPHSLIPPLTPFLSSSHLSLSSSLTPPIYYGYSSWPVLTVFRKDDGYPLLPFKLVPPN